MKGYLIRVGIDSDIRQDNIGYCAPIFDGNRFEFIPLPNFWNDTSERLTYGTLEAKNKKYGSFLSDFMHTDRHLFELEGDPLPNSIDDNGDPLFAKDLRPHHDPEFVTKTYGDFWGRIPTGLQIGHYVFFYAGLSRYDPSFYNAERTWQALARSQIHNKCPFLIGYLKIKRIFDIRNEEELLRNRSEIENNAHFKEKITPTVILKGEDESKLFDKAVQLYYWDPAIKKYSPTDVGKKIGLLKPILGVRVKKWLNETQCKELLEIASRDP